MEQNKSVKRLVDDSNLIPTPCGRGSSCASEASYKCRGGVFGLNNRNGNPPTLTLPLRWGGNRESNSGNSQSLIKVNDLTSCASELRARFDGKNDAVIADVNRRPVKRERVRNCPNVLTTSKKVAFTLAEVLITLGVIGIVAAMTIPTLINNYQEKVTVTKVKKMYSTLSQAVKLAEVDNGPVNTWDLPNYLNRGSQNLYGYLRPYLKVSKECVEDNSGKCIDESVMLTYLSGDNWQSASGYAGRGYVKAFLADGSLIWLRSNGNGSCGGNEGLFNDSCGLIWYDVNGSAAPNRLAKDIFVFVVRPKGIYPYDIDDCYLDNKGWRCAKYILEHDNMDYPATKPKEEE